jgi:hypothetical protein
LFAIGFPRTRTLRRVSSFKYATTIGNVPRLFVALGYAASQQLWASKRSPNPPGFIQEIRQDAGKAL